MNNQINERCNNSSGHVLSFEAELKEIMKRYEFDEAVSEDPFNERLYFQLCKIITEIMRKPQTAKLKINKEILSASQVQEILRQIGYEELRYVADRYSNIDYPVKYIKAYLTSALYNSVFESEGGLQNKFNCDMSRKAVSK